MTNHAHTISKALYRAAEFGGNATEFIVEGIMIDPNTGEELDKEGRPLYSDIPEIVGEIIPDRGEYTRNDDRLRELESTFRSGIRGF